MKKMRFLALILSIAMLVSMITACGSNGTTPSGNNQDAAGASGGGNDAVVPIRIGVMLDASGEFSNVGLQEIHSIRYTAQKINSEGGILGRPIELIEYDTQSDLTKYQEFTNRLIMEDNVDLVIGSVASFHREAIRPIFEENEKLLFYNSQYEGGVASKYTFCFGVTPEHQVLPMMKDMVERYGGNAYICSVDYNVGTITAKWFRQELAKYGGQVIGEEFIPFEVSQFSSAISKIVAARPDILITLMVGTNMSAFYEQWSNEGLAGQIPILSTTAIGMDGDHRLYNPPAVTGVYCLAPFIEELDTPAAQEFVRGYRAMFPDDYFMGLTTESCYVSLYYYKMAVEMAGTTETQAVLAALESGELEFDGPGGHTSLEPDTHHLTRDMTLFYCNDKHEIEIIATYPGVESNSFLRAMGIDLRVDAVNRQFEP